MLTPEQTAEMLVRRFLSALRKMQPHPHGDLLDDATEFLSRRAEAAEMLTLQAQLAYSAARSDIETCCAWAGDAPGRWYDTSNVLDNDPESIADSLRYLDLRGLLERHENGVWVRVRDEA